MQEEHGGIIRVVTAEETLLRAGRAALDALGEQPLYARVDLVRSNEDESYCLMELELIEPSLYLRMDTQAPRRFAKALDARMTKDSAVSYKNTTRRLIASAD